MIEQLESIAYLIVLGVLAVVFAYAIVRCAAFAYFRTKHEYFRRVMKETKEGDL